jgi:uncharacterized protein YdaU (DUF1376 family)
MDGIGELSRGRRRRQQRRNDVYMPWYVGDYLRDTLDLTCEEHGAYDLLLMALWTGRGYITSDPRRLARIAKLDLPRFEECWVTLQRFFQEADGDRLTQKRVLQERQNVEQALTNASEHGRTAGKASAAKRAAQRREADRSDSAKRVGPATPASNASPTGPAAVSLVSGPPEPVPESNPETTRDGPSVEPASNTSATRVEPAGNYPDPDPEKREGARAHDPPGQAGAGAPPTAHTVLHWYGLAWRDTYQRFWTPDRDANALARTLLEDQIAALPAPAAAVAYADIRNRIVAYLADRDPRLVKHCHPFRWFCDRFNALATPPKNGAGGTGPNGGGHGRKLFTGVEPP